MSYPPQYDSSWPPSAEPPQPVSAAAYGPVAQPVGYPPPPGYGYAPGYAYPTVPPTNGLAIASLVCSLVGFFVCPVLVSVIGAILGHVARGQIRDRGEAGSGLALSGILIGWIGVGLWIIGIVVYFVFVVAVLATVPTTDYPTPYPS